MDDQDTGDGDAVESSEAREARDSEEQSDERYRELVERWPMGVFFCDRNLRLTSHNLRFTQIFAAPPDGHVGMSLAELRDPAAVAALRKAIAGEPASFDGPYVSVTTGVQRVITLRISPLRNRRGVVTGAIGVLDDVTEKVRAETALRESQQRLAAHVQRTPLGVIDWNLNFEVIAWNESATRIFGYSAEEAMGRVGLDLIVPEANRADIAVVWRDLIVRTGGERSTNENVTKDGRRIFCDWFNTPIVDRHGAVIGVASLVLDMTARLDAEDALKRSEARFRALIEHAPDAIAVIRNMVFIYANQALVILLGFASTTELVGTPISDRVHDDDRHIIAERFALLVPGGVLAPQEYRLLRRDGSLVAAEIVSLRIDFDGEPATITIVRDISERKLMQARLLQADRMVSVGTLAAGVAHEINNPLAYLMANLDVVVRRKLPQITTDLKNLVQALADRDLLALVPQGLLSSADVVGQMLDVAREGAERVRNIVRDLKTFSRADDEKRGPIDIHRVLDASINIAWIEIRHRAQLVKSYEAESLVLVNESRIGQVFLNLLVNAAQALPLGSVNDNTITVRTSNDAQGNVLVEISDTGPGIPEPLLSRIFDPFFTTKPIGVGTGLGLWICQGIVTAAGGEIMASSVVGQGSTFRVTLPAAKSASPAPPVLLPNPTAPVELGARRARILVIDDEVALALAISAELADEHDVVASRSGRDAIELIQRDDKFDVIFCDLLMPDVTGMDVFERVCAARPWLRDRFVFMTGGAFAGRAREFLDRVGNTTLDKPFEMGRVRALISSL